MYCIPILWKILTAITASSDNLGGDFQYFKDRQILLLRMCRFLQDCYVFLLGPYILGV